MAPQSDGRSHQRRHKRCASRTREYCRKFTAFMFTNVGVIGLVIGYIIAGAFIFQAIEGESAAKRASDMSYIRKDTAFNMWKIAYHTNTFDENEFKKQMIHALLHYQKIIVNATRTGWDGPKDHNISAQWSFSGSFLYSLTVITTIGYGNISPKTDVGKLMTVCYAVLGMPLFLLYLTNIGDILARSFKWWYATVCLCRACPQDITRRNNPNQMALECSDAYEMVNFHSGNDEQQPSNSMKKSYRSNSIETSFNDIAVTDSVTVPVSVCVTVMVSYIIFGAMLFRLWEEWDLVEGSYFCFISLTSIGFGDLVPGDELYAAKLMDTSFIVCSLYLLLGMALIAMCFNLMQEQVIQHITSTKRCLRGIFSFRRK